MPLSDVPPSSTAPFSVCIHPFPSLPCRCTLHAFARTSPSSAGSASVRLQHAPQPWTADDPLTPNRATAFRAQESCHQAAHKWHRGACSTDSCLSKCRRHEGARSSTTQQRAAPSCACMPEACSSYAFTAPTRYLRCLLRWQMGMNDRGYVAYMQQGQMAPQQYAGGYVRPRIHTSALRYFCSSQEPEPRPCDSALHLARASPLSCRMRFHHLQRQHTCAESQP
eukprot:6182439-Pleurochrysis_carterae.AAC.2